MLATRLRPPPSAIYVVGCYSRILRFHPDTFAEISPDDPLKEPRTVGYDRSRCRMERFTSDPSLLAFSDCTAPYNIRVFNIETRTRVVTMNPSLHHDHTDGLAVIDDDPTRRTTPPLVVSGDDGSLGVIWDATTGEMIAKNDNLPIEYICRLLYVSDWNQSLFACGNIPDLILRLDVERSLTAIDGWKGEHQGQVDDLCPDVEKGVLASVGHDQTLNLWDIRGNGKSSISLRGSGLSVLCLPERHRVLVGLGSGSVLLFDLRNASTELSSLGVVEEAFSINRQIYALERVRLNSFAGIVAVGTAFLASIKPSDELEIVALHQTPAKKENNGIRMLGDRRLEFRMSLKESIF